MSLEAHIHEAKNTCDKYTSASESKKLPNEVLRAAIRQSIEDKEYSFEYEDKTPTCTKCGKKSAESGSDYCISCILQTTKNTPTKGRKYDTGKLRYSLVPPVAIKGIAEVLTFGASKYGPNNWQLVDNAEERYLDALYRHLEAYRAGESHDPESGLSHLDHAATNAAFLQYFESKKSATKEEHDGISTNSR